MDYSKIREFFKSKSTIMKEEDLRHIETILDELQAKESKFSKDKAEDLKNKGNDAFKNGDMQKALDFYTMAIEADPLNHLVYSNRALVYSKLNMDEEGLKDCLTGIKLDPTFVKFYIRAGMFCMKTDKAKAHEFFLKGLEYEPNNKTLQELVESTENQSDVVDSNNPDNMENLFDGMNSSKLKDLLKNEKMQKMVKDFVKDKSPEDLAEMMKNAFGSMKK